MSHSTTTRLKNVHLGVVSPGLFQHVSMVKGDYEYWHYCCDGTDDRGWGCGYRTLQTMCSWIKLQHLFSLICTASHEQNTSSVPNTASFNNGANCSISDSIINKGTDIRHDINIVGSGDACCQFATSDVDDAKIVVVTSGNTGRTEHFQTPLSCLASKCDGENDKHNTSEIVVLSNVNSSSKSETSKSASVVDQDVCDKNWDTLDIQVISCGEETKKPSQSLPSSEETVERRGNPQTESSKVQDVPDLLQIQKALVHIGDKPDHFVGSRQWIGSYEVCLCLDYFYDVPCKIVHISRGAELKQHLSTLYTHFSTFGSPVMMGGDSDASSKGIVGVCLEPEALLVVDPHHSGKAQSVTHLQNAGWVKWILVKDFHQTSFYNICLPQLAAKDAQKRD